jgi:HEAT repeat protein
MLSASCLLLALSVLPAGQASGPDAALLDFFRGRARSAADAGELRSLVRQLGEAAPEAHTRAMAELISRGPAAVSALRETANDLKDLAAAGRARKCLKWVQGSNSAALATAVAHLLAERKPAGAVPVLLAYVPRADNLEVVHEVTNTLAALAFPDGRPDPVLLKGLEDEVPLRRAVAAEALARAGPGVRLRVALALLQHEDPEGGPVLIELLTELPEAERKQAEEALQEAAGDWSPKLPEDKGDAISLRIRRDAWAAWWKNTSGPALLAEFRKRTADEGQRKKIEALVARLGADEFALRERAMTRLMSFGRLAVPFLQEAARGKDQERARRAQSCLDRLLKEDKNLLPTAAPRLLALRRPAGAVATLLAYVPWSNSDEMTQEVQKALTALAVRDGKPDPALVRALGDDSPQRRLAAGLALAHAGGRDLWPALHKLTRDPDPRVRSGVSSALIAAGDRAAVPLLIDALADLPSDERFGALDLLSALAGEKSPEQPAGNSVADRRKLRDAWAAWWKAHAAAVDLARLAATERLLGYTLLVEADGRVREISRDGKTRWQIDGLQYPVDAYVIGPDRVLITEYNGRRVTERDFKGKILWKYDNLPNMPVNAQRLPGGNVFIATMNDILEVNRKGKEVLHLNVGGVIAACKARSGHIVCLMQQGECRILDARGKEIKSFRSGRFGGWTSGLDLGPAGRILVAMPSNSKVVEFDRNGKTVWQAAAPSVTTATRLPNGHVLTASYGQQTVVELDRNGHTVWQFRSDRRPFRARRR